MRGLAARMGHIMLYRKHQVELYGWWRGLASIFADRIETFIRPQVRLD